MGGAAVYYFGKVLQLMGIFTVVAALFVFNDGEGGMEETFKLTGAGMAEFFAGYWLVKVAGKSE